MMSCRPFWNSGSGGRYDEWTTISRAVHVAWVPDHGPCSTQPIARVNQTRNRIVQRIALVETSSPCPIKSWEIPTLWGVMIIGPRGEQSYGRTGTGQGPHVSVG
jgi:hypothetical protein